ncbi:MAG: maleylpyruvate isomerase N-terminal domain-containing protein [Anaerolineales bacterium]|nr:maleylpyruvate isomerase N-terminal domain-containing protein [Anaerolineales bacterium]
MNPVGPIYTAELFAPLHTGLMAVLRDLTTDEWQRSTACSPWTVKDVAAHLLDTQVRRLSFHRDGLPVPPADRPITSVRDLTDYLDSINDQWVAASRRVSPRLLVDALDATGPQLAHFFTTLDPDQPAFFAVAWAGEETSLNWFDIAREFTEQWLHQQHIREAVGQPLLDAPDIMHPVLDTFLRALPHTYGAVEAADGTGLVFVVTGSAGGVWSLQRQANTWQLYTGPHPAPTTRVTLDQDAAWRICTKGIAPAEAEARMQIEGDRRLGLGLLNLVSIMA